MSEEIKPAGQNPVSEVTSKQKEAPEKIAIHRGPGYVPGLLDSQDNHGQKKPVFIGSKRRRLPPWAVAIAVFLAIMAGLFLIVPQLMERKESPLPTGDPNAPGFLETEVPSDGHSAIIKVSSAPVFSSVEPSGIRIAEALLNERVTMIDTSDRTMIRARLEDGTEGFILRDHLSADLQSLSLSGILYKVVVRTPFKRVMSHARSGVMLVEAPMGTVLYADYRNADLLRVRLPEGKSGWINAAGVLLLEPDAPIQSEDFDQQFISALMAFCNRPLVPGGVTIRGISPEGAVFIAARLNGLDVPRTIGALESHGRPVSLPADEEGLKDLKELEEGDLLFISKKSDPSALESVAICVEDAQLLIALSNRQALRLIDLESAQAREIASRITSVRRLKP